MEAVFRALADPTRRDLLDRLHRDDGQTLGDLVRTTRMTRQAVSKHLAVLEEAGLVTTLRVGRSKHHYINAVPIRLIGQRWIDKFDESVLDLVAGVKRTAEERAMDKPKRRWEVYIKAQPETIWNSVVDPDVIARWSHNIRPDGQFGLGREVIYRLPDGSEASKILIREWEFPRRMVMEARMLYDPALRDEPPYLLTWELEPVDANVTRLTVSAEFEAENNTFRLISGGQQPLLDNLKTLLETGETMFAAAR